MPKRRPKKTLKQPSLPPAERSIIHQKGIEGLVAAITSNTEVETERLLTSLRLLRSCFTEEQLRTPVAHIFKDNLPNVSIEKTGENGAFEVRWKDENCNRGDLNASLMRGLSSLYPQWKGFEFSSGVGPKGVFGADDMQMSEFVTEGLSDSQMVGMQDGLRTPAVSGQRLSIGMTPKTLRLPKPGEMILSVRGSPLGVYKEENMEAIHESEEG